MEDSFSLNIVEISVYQTPFLKKKRGFYIEKIKNKKTSQEYSRLRLAKP